MGVYSGIPYYVLSKSHHYQFQPYPGRNHPEILVLFLFQA